MDARAYFSEVVEPTVEEFRKEQWVRRRAFLACMVLTHTVDHIAGGKDGNLTKSFRTRCPEFQTVEDICNAAKHVQSDGKPPRLRAADLDSRPPAIWGLMQWDKSRWDDHVGGVEYIDGKDLFPLVATVCAFMRKELELTGE